MKKTALQLGLWAGALGIGLVFSANSGGVGATSSLDRTGSPIANGQTCGACHAGASFTASVNVSVYTQGTTDLVQNYVPGTTYDVRVEVTGSTADATGFGFQAVAMRSDNNAQAGSLLNQSSNARITDLNSRSYAEQVSRSSSGVFTFQWTAPAAGTGEIKFFAAGLASNSNGTSSGDAVATAVYTMPEEGVTSILASAANSLRIFPNPFQDQIQIELPAQAQSLELYNSLGQLLRQENVRTQAGQTLSLSLNNLPAGVYSLQIRQKNGLLSSQQLLKR